jgi:hypothetical protein
MIVKLFRLTVTHIVMLKQILANLIIIHNILVKLLELTANVPKVLLLKKDTKLDHQLV